MEGRWLLNTASVPFVIGPRPFVKITEPTWVVPCDDAAIRRAFDALHDDFDLATGWEDDVHGLSDDELREVVLAVLRAAGADS